jgi:hypothetical protein
MKAYGQNLVLNVNRYVHKTHNNQINKQDKNYHLN